MQSVIYQKWRYANKANDASSVVDGWHWWRRRRWRWWPQYLLGWFSTYRKFVFHVFQKGRTDLRTDGPPDGPTDGHTLIEMRGRMHLKTMFITVDIHYVGQGPPYLPLGWCPYYGGRGLVEKSFSLHLSHLQKWYPSLGSWYSFIGGGGEYRVFHAEGTIVKLNSSMSNSLSFSDFWKT